MCSNRIIQRTVEKARKTPCTYKVAVAGFSRKGNLLGICTNSYRFNGKHRGAHAEMQLIRRYGKKIHTILLIRTNKTGGLLKVEPCEKCQKVLDKLGIKVITSVVVL